MAAILQFRLTGGYSNSDPSLSLGSSTSYREPISIPMHNLFKLVNEEESADGTGDYICLDIYNAGDEVATLVSIHTSPPNRYSSLQLSLGINGSPLTRNRKTHPSGLIFTEHTIGSPMTLSDLNPGSYHRIWVERLIHRNSEDEANDLYSIIIGWNLSVSNTLKTSWVIIKGSSSYNTTNLLDHTNFTFENKSNIDVKKEELENDFILDVPVFPPQNIIIDDDTVNIYDDPTKQAGYKLSFIWNNSIYVLMELANDQRMVFLQYSDGARTLIYRFGGKDYPQDRISPSFALTATGLLMWGGQDSTQICRRELWNYNCSMFTWTELHPDKYTGIDFFPSARYESSFIEHCGDLYICGGKSYSFYVLGDLELNDLWFQSAQTGKWLQLDQNAHLPHSMGHIVWVSTSVIKILYGETLWTVPKDGTDPIEEPKVDSLVKLLSSTKYTFTPQNGEVHFVTTSDVLKWDNASESLVKIMNECSGISYHSTSMSSYIQEGTDHIRRGSDSIYQPYIEIYHPRIKSTIDSQILVDCKMNGIPVGDYMASCGISDHSRYMGLGMIKLQGESDPLFIEDHWIWDGRTLNVTKVPQSNFSPQDRLEASCCWDKKRNRVWLFGGYSGSQYYNDLWFLDLTELIWTRVRDQIRNTVINGVEYHPQARAKAAIICVDDSLWIVSGYSDKCSFNDMWEYYINTDEAVQVQLNDWVPFGTDYEIFEWRDRMWLFNGENLKLYRYFYDFRIWQPVLLYTSRQDTKSANKMKAFEDFLVYRSLQIQYNNNLFIKTNATVWLPENLNVEEFGESIDTRLKKLYLKVRGKDRTSSCEGLERNTNGTVIDPRASVFLTSPITVSLQLNYLIITYNETNVMNSDLTGESSTIKVMMIDMDSKEVMPLPGNIGKGLLWSNATRSLSVTGQLYYYNISSFELGQWNQTPYFDQSIDPWSTEFGLSQSSVLMPYYDPDTVGGVTERFCYFDRNNMYILYQDQITYTPLIPTNDQMVKGGLWGEYQCHSDYIVFGTPLEPIFSKESLEWCITRGSIIRDDESTIDRPGALIKTVIGNPDDVIIPEYETFRVHNIYYRSDWASYPSLESQEMFRDYSTPGDVKWVQIVGHDWVEQNVERLKKNDKSFRECPRFLWRRVPKGAMNTISCSELHWKDNVNDRVYSVNGKDGSISRISTKTRTSLIYPTRLWKESSYAHSANTVFAFGGSIIGTDFEGQFDKKPVWYKELMKAVSMGMYRSLAGVIKYAFILDSHDGFMKYDLDGINTQMNMLSGREKGSIRDRDYDGIRDYLVSKALSYGIRVGDEMSDDWVEELSNTLYSSTLGVAGDLAVRFFKNENGQRPFGPRVGAMLINSGPNLFLFGGCFKFFQVEELDKDIILISPHYTTSFPYDFTFDDVHGKYTNNKNWGYGDSYKFDTITNTWIKLADLPVQLFGATATIQPDEKIIWLVGGFISDISVVNHEIFKYDIEKNKWSTLSPMPIKYKGRGKPNCSWIDEHRLLIIFGFLGTVDNMNGVVNRRPWGDSWIIDKSKGIMYKFFENTSKTSICIENLSKSSDSEIDMLDFLSIFTEPIYKSMGVTNPAQFINKFADETLNSPGDELFKLPNYVSSTSKYDNSPHFYWNKIDSFDGSIKGSIRIDIHPGLVEKFSPMSIIDMFRGWNDDIWMLVNHGDGEQPSDRGLEVYRLAKLNELHYSMDYLALDKPSGNRPVIVGSYMRNGKVLVAWNGYNIYELDLRLAAYNPNGKYWRRLPPEPNLTIMGMNKNNNFTFADGVKKDLDDPGKVRFYKANGSIISYDRTSMLWTLEREDQWGDRYTVVTKDVRELNYYSRGTTDGRIVNLSTMQTDKFYYDSELLKPVIDLAILEKGNVRLGHNTKIFKAMVSDFGDCDNVGNCTLSTAKMSNFLSNNRSTIKRGRIYAWNENNHIMRAWTRKHAELDLHFVFDNYYRINRVDISVDYDTMAQADKFKVDVLTNVGWKSLQTQHSQEARGWDWSPSNRVYRKQVLLTDGYTYMEDTRPGYYIRAAGNGLYIKGARIRFFPKAEEWNYIARINHIYLVSDDSNMIFSDGEGDLKIYYVAPFSSEDSSIYTVKIRNNHPLSPATNIKIYLRNNFRTYLSLNNKVWVRPTIKDPLIIYTTLSPSENFTFYLQMKTSLDRANLDFIISADYPLE